MNVSKTLEYLSIIIDLEKDKYAQEQFIKKMKHNISSCETEFNDNIRLNDQCLLESSYDFKNIRVSDKGKWIKNFMIYYVGYMGGYIGYVMGSVVLKSKGSGLLGALIGAVAGGSIPVFIWKNILKKRRERALADIQSTIRIDKELSLNRQIRNDEIRLMIPKLEKEVQEMQKLYNLTCNTLKKCYEIDIIPVKYRNIVPVCAFYEYISSGRTYSIKRNPQAFDEGAINMYDRDLKYANFSNKLDIIINNLEDLKEGQKVLRKVIEDGNRRTHQLLNDINNNITSVNRNLNVIQYQNNRRDTYLKYMSDVTYQRYMTS